MHFRALMRWLRIEDEQGQFSLTSAGVFFGAGVMLAGGSPLLFLAALFAYLLKRFLQHVRSLAGLRVAHEYRLRELELSGSALQDLKNVEEELREKLRKLSERAAEIELNALKRGR